MLFFSLLCLLAALLAGIFAYQTSQKNLHLSRGAEEMERSLKNQLAQLENEKTQSSLILHHLNEGVIGVDSRQRILFINPSAESILKIPPKSGLGKTLMEITHNTQIEETMNTVLRRHSFQSVEMALIYPEEKTLRISAIGLPKEAGTMRGIVVFYDITKVKKLENMRREFVANVSHELKTPLTSIHGFIETLLGGALKNTAQSETFLKMMREDTERLNRLIHDLLELSKIESRETILNLESVNLSKEITKAVLVLEARIQEKSLKVEIKIPDSLPPVLAGRDQLKQILLNLLENAVKFNTPGGQIQIAARVSGEFVEVSIRDTGVGIPSESTQRVFERFFRLDKARTSDSGGTGLGLSIVKHLVEAHGGQVRCESALGKGSAFFFTLRSA